MGLTVFLAQIWGPIILAMGLGIFFSRKYYLQIYRDLEKETLAVFVFSIFAMAAGIVQILFHNSWNTLPATLISIIGWGMLIKGATFAIFPKLVDMGGNWVFNSKLISAIGVLTLLVGAYLTWIGYLA